MAVKHDNTTEPAVKRPSVPVMQMIDGRACWKAFGRDEYIHEPELERMWQSRKTTHMQPYYQDNLITLYHGRCEAVMPMLEACSFDAVIN